MSGYLGNPKFVMMAQDSIPIANFEYPADPVPTVNPVRVPVSWLNTVTGELFVCIDNTTDANVWLGSLTRSATLTATATQSFTINTWTTITFASSVDPYSVVSGNSIVLPKGSFAIRLSGSFALSGSGAGECKLVVAINATRTIALSSPTLATYHNMIMSTLLPEASAETTITLEARSTMTAPEIKNTDINGVFTVHWIKKVMA